MQEIFSSLEWRQFIPLKNGRRLVSGQWLYLIILFVATDWTLNRTLPKLLFEDEVEQRERIRGEKQVTVNMLIRNATEPIKYQAKHPLSRDAFNQSNKENWLSFTYEKAVCSSLILLQGKRNRFRICYPAKIWWRFIELFAPAIQLFTTLDTIKDGFPGNLAYFINGQRDELLERNLKRKMRGGNKLKIYTNQNASSLEYDFSAIISKNVDVKIFIDNEIYGENVMGIKDLIDSEDDYHRIEFIKYEMENKTDPIVFSINIPVFAAHLLLRVDNFAYIEFQYLIKRLAHSLYFPYAIEYDPLLRTHFVSLIHKYSMYKYNFVGIKDARWSFYDE